MHDEIIYPYPNFNGCTVDILEWITLCNRYDYFFMVEFFLSYMFMETKSLPHNVYGNKSQNHHNLLIQIIGACISFIPQYMYTNKTITICQQR